MFKYGDRYFKVRDLAYAAAIVDGEGCISATNRNGLVGTNVGVFNTDRRLVDWFVEMFGGTVYSRKYKNPRHAPSFQWRIEAKRVTWFLRLILPHLKIKRKQAYLLMAIRDGIEKGKKDERVFNLVKKIHVLNRKGKNHPTTSETMHVGSLNQPGVRDWAYMAGLLDGEGTIFHKTYGSARTMRVEIVNRESALMKWCQDRFGGYVYYQAGNERHSATAKWRLPQPEIPVFLPQVLPYLRLKRLAAEAVLAERMKQSVPFGDKRVNAQT